MTSKMYVEHGDIKYLDENLAILGCYNQEDGSGYIHCLLESFHPTYVKTRSGNYRIYLAKSIRLGAIPEIIKENYKPEDLTKYRPGQRNFYIENPYSVYTNASSYGSPLRPELLHYYANYLGVSYRLFDANFDLIQQFKVEGCPYTNIFKPSDDEYHLIVRLRRSKRDDPPNTVRYSITDVIIPWIKQ